MLNYQSPGVYIEEVESGAKPIEVAGTSTAAFVGFAGAGEAMKPTPIESYGEYENDFRQISDNGSAPGDVMAFSVRGFFDNGGRRAYVLNVSSGGTPSTATLAERTQAADALLVLETRATGTQWNGVEVSLTPTGPPEMGTFDFRLTERVGEDTTEIEEYRQVTLAPGFPESLELVLDNSDSKVKIVDIEVLEPKVLPSLVLAFGTTQVESIATTSNIGLEVGGKTFNHIDFTSIQNMTAADATRKFEEILNGLPLPGRTEFVCRFDSTQSSMRCLARTTDPDLGFAFINLPADIATALRSETRGELLGRLVRGARRGDSLAQAVLSGSIDTLDVTRLAGKHLDVRFGDNFARRVVLDRIDPQTSLAEVAGFIEEGINRDAPPTAVQSLKVGIEDGRCVISQEASAPAGATFADISEPSPLFIKEVQNSGRFSSPLFLLGAPNIEVQYDDNGSWVSAADRLTAETLLNLRDQLRGLKRADGIALFDSVNYADYTLVLETQDKVRLVTSTDDANGITILRAFGAAEGALELPLGPTAAGTPIESRIATLNALLTGIGFQVAEGTAGPLDITVTNPDDPGTLDGLQEKIETAFAEAVLPAADLKVEWLGDRLLLWDKGAADVTVLESTSKQSAVDPLRLSLARGAKPAPLSEIQPGIPIVDTLSNGTSGVEGDRSDYQKAFEELEKIPEIAIICLPGNHWDRNTGYHCDIVDDAINHAKQQNDRMVIVDPPKPGSDGTEWKDRNAVQSAELPASEFVAVYYPWLRVLVPSRRVSAGKPADLAVPPSGFAAGAWSRTDRERGVWKAPAGVETRVFGVSSLEHELTDLQGGALNREGVNCIRKFPVPGLVVWGGRTRAVATAPQWKYLSVRRTALMIEDSLRESMLWATHEPNRSELWAALRLNIEAFLQRLHQEGAFQPDAARDAYFVKCGKGTTMTQADIDAGIVRVRVGIAPVKPAEFVVITIEQINEAS